MKLLRDPLIHFIVLGAVGFFISTAASSHFAAEAERRVEITDADIELLAATFQRQWQRPPTAVELDNLIESRVREEVLYREALAVGLDRDDLVVRRRMVQKMEMLSQDLATLADPTDQELQAFFAEHRETYRVPPILTFSHVFFNVDRRGDQAEADAEGLLADITSRGLSVRQAVERGDRFMLGYDYELDPRPEVERNFGTRFTDSVFSLEPGWHGPIASGYGLHLVYIAERIDGRIPELDEVRPRLVADFNRDRSQRARDALFEGLLERYEVSIDEEAVSQVEISGTRPSES
jgi:hypothetical protein